MSPMLTRRNAFTASGSPAGASLLRYLVGEEADAARPGPGVVPETVFEADAFGVRHAGLDDLRPLGPELGLGLVARADDGHVARLLPARLFERGHDEHPAVDQPLGLGHTR